MKTYTHKKSGWTRQGVDGSYGSRTRITPTDDSGERIVTVMHPGEWQNLDQDDKAREDELRVVVIEGAPLPEWTERWLLKVAQRDLEIAEANFQAQSFDADMNEWYGRGEW